MKRSIIILTSLLALTVQAQSLLHRVDSMLTLRYHKGNIDTAYVMRPQTKWTVRARLNLSGTKIRAEGVGNDLHFTSEMYADSKMTVSLGVSYLGISLSASLNPAKLLGKYRDYELTFNSYGRRFGFDFVYQDARNFNGWYEIEGSDRVDLPSDALNVKTLNANAYYVFNSRRFSYPAAFSQSYIQRRSAGSVLLAASVQGQQAKPKDEDEAYLKMTNIGIGAGYGYNFVPGKGWLLHISALPTFIVYSNTSAKIGDDNVPMKYHFHEVIITGRGAVVHNARSTFYGLSMNFNFTNIGDKDNLEKCFNAISKAIRELQDKPLSDRKLKAAKKQLLGQLAISSESGEAQCLSMGKSLLAFGRVASSAENKAAIEAVTSADLQSLARRIFSPDNLSRLVYL